MNQLTSSLPQASKSKMKLRQEAALFLEMAHAYLKCREMMDAKYLEADPNERLANFDDLPPNSLKPKYTVDIQQQSKNGIPVENLKELYEAADIAQSHYEQLIRQLVIRVQELCLSNGDNDGDSHGNTKDRTDHLRLVTEDHRRIRARACTINILRTAVVNRPRVREVTCTDGLLHRSRRDGPKWIFRTCPRV